MIYGYDTTHACTYTSVLFGILAEKREELECKSCCTQNIFFKMRLPVLQEKKENYNYNYNYNRLTNYVRYCKPSLTLSG
jgi:hypothetical protein